MAPQHVQWGTITLHLDNEAFRRGFLSACQWYFADIYGEDGRAPQEPQHPTALTAEEVLRLVVMPDEQGRYHFDEMGYENLASIPGLSRWLPLRAACSGGSRALPQRTSPTRRCL